MISDNAAPIYMFRIRRAAPFEILWVSRIIGPMKIEMFVGISSRNQFPPRPVLHGRNLALSRLQTSSSVLRELVRWVVWGGQRWECQ